MHDVVTPNFLFRNHIYFSLQQAPSSNFVLSVRTNISRELRRLSKRSQVFLAFSQNSSVVCKVKVRFPIPVCEASKSQTVLRFNKIHKKSVYWSKLG